MTLYGGLFDIEAKQKAIDQLEEKTYAADFWDDRAAAQAVLTQLSRRRELVKSYQHTAALLEEAEAALELAAEDEGFISEAEPAARQFLRDLERLELSQLLSGDYDSHDAVLSLHAGTGGLEAQDWTDMLLRMYSRWADNHGYKLEILDILPADEGGVKSAEISIQGANAYGYLKSERGVHRLVRMSPYDTAGRRHTSFASVDVLPQVADDNEIEIAPDDLRIDTYRSSGKGGQHLNKTDSAVRITHISTGIVTQCQNERSQLSNKDAAMRMLRARLLDLKLREREAELSALRGEQSEIGWGSQIRSYVFQPYRLVKDHRTGFEMGNTDAVMDGDLDGFIAEYLRKYARSD
ncbi:MAG: peptide chain release factor 2 [Clostridia bacterium]|nr:peptide chain release factor 2 [Clostridia bacterium]